jgi:hypothetical protein
MPTGEQQDVPGSFSLFAFSARAPKRRISLEFALIYRHDDPQTGAVVYARGRDHVLHGPDWLRGCRGHQLDFDLQYRLFER